MEPYENYVARICHEANRAYCSAMGDHSQPAWADAPQWQKDSAIAGVKFLRENPGALPEHSHESWLRHKEAEGWKYGKVKNPDKKRHPCMVPFDKLPAEQRAKDHIFHAIVRAMTTPG